MSINIRHSRIRNCISQMIALHGMFGEKLPEVIVIDRHILIIRGMRAEIAATLFPLCVEFKPQCDLNLVETKWNSMNGQNLC